MAATLLAATACGSSDSTEINKASIETLATLGKNDGVFGDKTPDLSQLLP